jgi:hypothetical protein
LIIFSPSVASAIRAFLFLLHALEVLGRTTANNPELDAEATWWCFIDDRVVRRPVSEPRRYGRRDLMRGFSCN